MRHEERDDLFVRCHGPFEKGFVYRGHRHWIDHQSFVRPGTKLVVRYRLNNNAPPVREVEYEGPCRFLVAAGLFHEIEILSDVGFWDCEFKKPPADSPLGGLYHQEMLD